MKHLFTLLSAFVLSGSALLAQTQILAPMPAQTSTFTGNVRGYYFVSPTCFTITGVEVPNTASSGAQSIAVVRFQTTPPAYSATTNNFSVLYLTQNNSATGIIPVNIPVEQGDIIGVLGQRATVNSYSSTGNTTTIHGNTVTLNRLGMQFPLTTTAPQQLWTEASGSISRVNLYYDTLITLTASATPTGPLSAQFNCNADTSFTTVWNFGDGSPLLTADNPSHTYATAGVYNVCAYVTNSCGTDTICTSVSFCGPQTTAAYTSSSTFGSAQFTDASTNATGWSWDFGDGSPIDNSQNPSHTYTASGNYTVCMIAAGPCGFIDTVCQNITICLPATASYSSSSTFGAVSFTDASTEATSWSWDFGDGSPADNSQNPTHTYTTQGTFTVCLIASNACSADTFCSTVTICLAVTANYSASVPNNGTVSFTDLSSNASGWSWDFGDGSPADNSQNPTHTYTTNGTYTVCLTAINNCDTSFTCATVTICLPVTAAYTSSTNGATATFTDGSTNANSWAWDFGDGSPTDNSQNPTHLFAANGTYNVCVIASSSCASDTLCDTVTVCEPANAAFTSSVNGGTVNFTSTSNYNSSWSWNFGDFSPVDNNQNPAHTYLQNGTYNVCLIAGNACSSDTVCNDVTVCPVALTASFGYTDMGMTTFGFSSTSSGASSVSWNFGDGSPLNSNINVNHTFPNNNTSYIVCLTVYNVCGDSTTSCDTVVISGIAQYSAVSNILVSPNPFNQSAELNVNSSSLSGAFTFEMTDLSGKLISTQNGIINQSMRIQRDGIASGVYLYRVTRDHAVLGIGKLVIE